MSVKLSQLIGFKEAVPEKKEVSPHEFHTMDDNYCYNCQEIVDNPPNGNHKFNEAIDQLSEVEVTVDVEKLPKKQSTDNPASIYSAGFIDGWNACHNSFMKSIATSLPEIFRLTKAGKQ